MIPYGRHHISEDDIKAVEEVLKSAFLTQGDKVALFEQTIAQYVGAKYAYAVNSATSALHIACLAIGLGEGDWLWTTPITYVASANCGRYCGANVDFVDIDPKTLNMSIDALEEKLRIAKLENRLPKVVVPVHLCGEPCDMKQIHRLSQEYGFKIIEDASHAIGRRPVKDSYTWRLLYTGLPCNVCSVKNRCQSSSSAGDDRSATIACTFLDCMASKCGFSRRSQRI